MASYNKIVLVGNLTKDPELKYTPQGKQVASFGLAVGRGFKSEETDFFNVNAWERLAETCGQYLKKGKQVLIEGRVQIRNYETQDGQKRTAVEVVATDMRMLGTKGDSGGDSSSYSAPSKSKASGKAQKPPAEDVSDIDVSDGSNYEDFDPDEMPF